MSRNRNRERTSFSLSLLPDGSLSHQSSRSLPLIMMMETSHLRPSHHLAHFRGLNSTRLRAIHIEGQMGTKAVVIGDIRRQYPLKMPFVAHDDMIEYVATETADEPLAVGIVPGAARGNLHLFDTQVFYSRLEGGTVDRVPVSQQVTGR